MRDVPANIIRGRLSAAERERIAELAERRPRLTPAQIARKMNRHPGTINFAMHAMGLRDFTPGKPRRPFQRGNSLVVAFSPDEDAWITAQRVQGHSTPEIASMCRQVFGHARSAATIGIRLKMLANKEDAA